MNKTKYYYKDIADGKIHYTRGKFVGWTKPTGLIKARYAIFQTRATELLIPKYLLTKETLALLPKPEEIDNIQQAIRDGIKSAGFLNRQRIEETKQWNDQDKSEFIWTFRFLHEQTAYSTTDAYLRRQAFLDLCYEGEIEREAIKNNNLQYLPSVEDVIAFYTYRYQLD